jgi:threonine/homoserine/homoserine lactone efflux protein
MADGVFSFLLICLVVELTPGPNMAYLTMISSVHGRKAGFSMVAGITAGLFVVGLVATLGAAALVLENPTLYHSLRGAGILYLLWLAWDSWRTPALSTGIAAHFDHRSFWRGFVTNILNPKAWMFYVTVLPAFIDTSRPFLGQALAMTTAYVMVATLVHSTIAILGERGGRYLHGPAAMKTMRYVFSGLLLGLAIWFAWSTQPR